ncbi:MAG: WXG100 family type VII secretion target [Jatrophihabitans sp.]
MSLKVTPEQLQSLSGSVARTASDVQSAHASLRGQLAPLFGADWVGAASAQFNGLYEDFDKGARTMSEALAGIGRLLHSAGSNYASAEQQIAASFRA